MGCEEAYEWMQRDLDGELSDAEKAKLMRHQAGCRDCASLYERLHSLSTHLEQLPMVAPPFPIVESILPELDRIDRERATPSFEQEQAVALEFPHRQKRRAIWYRYIGGATVAGLLISAIVLTMDDRETNQSASSSPQITQVQDAPEAQTRSKTFAAVNEQIEVRQKTPQPEGSSSEALPPAAEGTAKEVPSADASKPETTDTGQAASASKTDAASNATEHQPTGEAASKPEGEQSSEPGEEAPSTQPDREPDTVKPTEPAEKPAEKPAESEVAVAQARDASEDNKAMAGESKPSVENGQGDGAALAFAGEDQAKGKGPAKPATAAGLTEDTYKPPGKPSPGQTFFLSKTDNALLVRNAGGGIEFVTHTWNEMYNVSYRWIAEKQIIYKLEYIGQPGKRETTAQSQEWLIDLEKNIERPLFNK